MPLDPQGRGYAFVALIDPSTGNSGGAITVADGADATQGAKADATATNTTASWSVVSLLRGALAALGFGNDAAYAGTGSPSIIGALKGLYAALIAPTPAGTNTLGGVFVVQSTADYTDRSGTVAAANSAQNSSAVANTARQALIVANPSTTLGFWWNAEGTAGNGTAGSTYMAPGGKEIYGPADRVPKGAISIYGTTAGQPYTVKEA